ncbi:MAG: hypothetical protein H6914_07480 [Novosphingobium sp.]|nr:hypothetical protein [Novosphingobium sp.]
MSFNAIPDTQAVEERPRALLIRLSIADADLWHHHAGHRAKGAVQATASLANPAWRGSRRSSVQHRHDPQRQCLSLWRSKGFAAWQRRSCAAGARHRGLSEIGQRHARFNVTPEQAALLRGPLHIEFTEPADKGGATLATLDATLP